MAQTDVKKTYVMVDDFIGEDANVIEQIIVEADAIKSAALAELERQVEVRRSVLAKARGGSIAPEGKKRGPKPKKAVVSEDEAPEVSLDDDSDDDANGAAEHALS